MLNWSSYLCEIKIQFKTVSQNSTLRFENQPKFSCSSSDSLPKSMLTLKYEFDFKLKQNILSPTYRDIT